MKKIWILAVVSALFIGSCVAPHHGERPPVPPHPPGTPAPPAP